MKNILVTGGTGYIGSHTVVELLQKNYNVIIVDNLSNSKKEVLNRIEQITGKKPIFYKTDIRDKNALSDIFSKHDIDAVIHFAGFKAVGESVEKPIEYYHNNVYGSLILFDVMRKFDVKKIVFSSSSTVYGYSTNYPFKEDEPTSATNPYGRSKLMIEEILKDIYVSDNNWSIILLRYFNPVGAHKSGLIGEDPNGIPNNLFPYVSKVALGTYERLNIFGNDYPTKDGTGIRDYIHVVDLSLGHISALKKLSDTGVHIYNLGTGNGYSVLDIVKAFEKASGKKINYTFTDRRAGDVAISYCDPTKAKKELDWEAKYTLDDMCKDSWNWQTKNPNGYDK